MIGWQHFSPWLENQNLARYRIGGEISISSPFCQNLGKYDFFWKKGLCQFLNIPIIYHRAKNHKKLMSHLREKCRTDRQTGNSNFIGPSVGRGSKNPYSSIKCLFNEEKHVIANKYCESKNNPLRFGRQWQPYNFINKRPFIFTDPWGITQTLRQC